MHRTQQIVTDDLSTLSSNELKGKFDACNEAFQESCVNFLAGLANGLEVMKAGYKKHMQEEYLKSNTMEYTNQISQIHLDSDLLIKIIQTEQNIQKVSEAKESFTRKWPAFIVLHEQKVEIKKESELTYYLGKNDIEKAFIVVEFQDLFDELTFSRAVEIPINNVKLPIEDNFAKIDKRIAEARKEQAAINRSKQEDYKKSFSYKAFTFFNSHPIASTTILAIGCAAVGVTAGLTADHLIETMGYKK